MQYSEIILSTHAFVPVAELKVSKEELEKRFTLTSRFEPDLTIPLYKSTETHFGYPLYLHPYERYTEHLKDRRTEGRPINISMCPGFTPRDNQKDLLASFRKSLENGNTGWLVTMPTGAGKTVCALAMLQAIARTCLVIVPRESLMKQWMESITAFTSVRPEEIGTAQQDVCEYEGKKVVIGMIHSLAKNKYPKAFVEAFGLVIWDEVHVAGAQSFSQTLSIFAPKYRIGMSATPNRRDGLHDIYKTSIGQTILSIRNETLLHPTVYVQKFTPGKIRRNLNFVTNANFRRAKLISILAEDKGRNALLADHIAKLAESDRRIVVFSERIAQIEHLSTLLLERGLDPGCIGIFTGQTKEEDRTTILTEKKIILATYGVMAMGVDVPDLRALVFATPQSNVTQPCGRILRIKEGTLDPVIIDIIDVAYQDCLHWAQYREHYYRDTAKATVNHLEPVVMPPDPPSKKSGKKSGKKSK
ncbi:MAG: DEAD/DEAH box helicase [Desulfovibrio sp.]|nr:DEAD/DEAH box helicase [Desulfovibrio sp.]